jgi:hypothetical protein
VQYGDLADVLQTCKEKAFELSFFEQHKLAIQVCAAACHTSLYGAKTQAFANTKATIRPICLDGHCLGCAADQLAAILQLTQQ